MQAFGAACHLAVAAMGAASTAANTTARVQTLLTVAMIRGPAVKGCSCAPCEHNSNCSCMQGPSASEGFSVARRWLAPGACGLASTPLNHAHQSNVSKPKTIAV